MTSHPLITQAACAASGDVAEAQAIANHLADVMKRIHGGDWSATINHLRCVVLVWQTDDRQDAQEEQKCAGGRGARRR